MTEGGINSPKTDETVTRAVEYPLGYPCSTILGMSIGPVAATPVNPLPDIAPIIAQVVTATTPIPPFTLPTNMSAKSSRFFAIPVPPISVPANINNGLASSIGLII